MELIDPDIAQLAAEELPDLRGAVDVVVHRMDDLYRFLHDNAVAWDGPVLHAAWYNCPEHEIAGASCIRGRRSPDGGRTWSPVEVIAADHDSKGTFYVPVAFCSHQTGLHAFVANMVGHDLVTQCEVYRRYEATGGWQSRGFIAHHFLPNCAPVRMANGNHLMAGRASENSEEKPAFPAVAISHGENLTAPWDVVRLCGHKLPLHPETTAWVNGSTVTAIVRGGPGRGPLVFTSEDDGRAWSNSHESNLPSADSKLYAGVLSTGQRYLVWNWPPDRETLVLGVSRPGEASLSAVWRIRHGFSHTLGIGPEWSYPCAVEYDGHLYVIYTSEKRHSVMTTFGLDCCTMSCS